jgi:hypothetical protein
MVLKARAFFDRRTSQIVTERDTYGSAVWFNGGGEVAAATPVVVQCRTSGDGNIYLPPCRSSSGAINVGT